MIFRKSSCDPTILRLDVYILTAEHFSTPRLYIPGLQGIGSARSHLYPMSAFPPPPLLDKVTYTPRSNHYCLLLIKRVHSYRLPKKHAPHDSKSCSSPSIRREIKVHESISREGRPRSTCGGLRYGNVLQSRCTLSHVAISDPQDLMFCK